MAEIIRELVQRHVMPAGPPRTDLSDLAGEMRTGRQTNVAADRDSTLADAARGFR
jgi:hypothetical protein